MASSEESTARSELCSSRRTCSAPCRTLAGRPGSPDATMTGSDMVPAVLKPLARLLLMYVNVGHDDGWPSCGGSKWRRRGRAILRTWTRYRLRCRNPSYGHRLTCADCLRTSNRPCCSQPSSFCVRGKPCKSGSTRRTTCTSCSISGCLAASLGGGTVTASQYGESIRTFRTGGLLHRQDPRRRAIQQGGADLRRCGLGEANA